MKKLSMYSKCRFIGLAPILIAVSLAACQTLRPGPEFNISERLNASAPPIIRAKNLTPGESYKLEIERNSDWGEDASEYSVTAFIADANGRINTAAEPVEIEAPLRPYLPFQSMSYENKPLDIPKGKVRLRLRDSREAVIAERLVAVGADRSGLSETPLGKDFPGAFVLRPNTPSRALPALVLLGGSEGGDSAARAQAPTFAAQGFAVLGLPYYSPAWFGQTAQIPGLPGGFDELAVDYLEDAVTKLRQRPGIDADHILLMGGSKGAEYVLLAGSLIEDTSPGGGFCAIVADVPSDVVWEGWGRSGDSAPFSGFSWRGEALPFVPYVDMGKALNARRTGDDYTMTDAHENGRAQYPAKVEAARIRVEQIDEPVLVIGGGQDEVWASAKMARNIKMTRDEAGLTTLTFIDSKAGHGVGGDPLHRTSKENMRARLKNFPATLSFLKENARRTDCRKG